MKIGIIGAGKIGSTLARNLVRAGHKVSISNSRLPRTLEGLVKELGGKARAVPAGESALESELVFEAIPFGRYASLPAVSLSGTIVVSVSNYYPDRDGDIKLGDNTQTELVDQHLPEATVVKAFNTIFWEDLRDQGDPDLPLEERRVIPLAGDDKAAKAKVATLIEEMGFAPLDLGGLREGGRLMEPDQTFFNKDLTLAEAKQLHANA